MRYKLLPTRGRLTASWFIEGTAEEALESATERYALDEVPIMVCEAPLEGIVKQLYIPSGLEQEEETMKKGPAEQAIEDFIQHGRWPKKGTLPVCIRLPQVAVLPPKPKSKKGKSDD